MGVLPMNDEGSKLIGVLQDPMQLWKAAYDEHGGAVLAFLRSRLPSRQDAEDLLQETFIRAIKSEAPLRDWTKVKSYLFTIAHNLMLNHHRGNRTVAVSSLGEEGERKFNSIPDDAELPDEMVSRHDLEAKIEELLAELPKAHRTAFELGVLQGKPYAEIAVLTGWSPAQVKINVYRARKAVVTGLRDELE